MYFGEPIDFSDLRPKANMLTTQKRAADRCLEAIRELGGRQRRDAAVRAALDPGSPTPPSHAVTSSASTTTNARRGS
jgi:hypothetical protein